MRGSGGGRCMSEGEWVEWVGGERFVYLFKKKNINRNGKDTYSALNYFKILS